LPSGYKPGNKAAATTPEGDDMSSWLKEKGNVIGGIAGTIAAFVAALQLFVVAPMNQRFDALERHMDQRFGAQGKYINERFDAVDRRFDAQDQRLDAQGQRLERLADEVAHLRELTISIGERVSRSEGQIEIIREQIKTVDAP